MSSQIKKQAIATNPLTGSVVFNSLKPLDLSNLTKSDIKNYFTNSYDLYETLFTSLKYNSVYYLCPDRLRLPLIFYYGHTAAVFVNKLVLSGLMTPSERINLEFDMTFETGVDEMSWDDTEHYRMGGSYKWPTVEEIKMFRLKVRELINKIIDRTPLELPITWDSPWWTLFMGFEHERIHYETSTVLIRQYPIHMVQKPVGWTYGPSKLNKSAVSIDNPMIQVPKTKVRLGKSYEYPSYGWDNEYGQVDCEVSAFEASKYKVTNEQFLEFVLNDGYQTREYWSDEGWEWVQFKQAKHPLFWVCPLNCKSGCGGEISSYTHCQERFLDDEQLTFYNREFKQQEFQLIKQIDENGNESNDAFPYKLRLMFDMVPMPTNWPVEVNYHEAKAYCKWKGDDFRVISEAEHHAIRDEETFELSTNNDIIYQDTNQVNHNLVYGSSTPVNKYPPNSKGFHDVYGNTWEWTEDHFNALSHKTHYLYDDFSSPCYDGRHNIIMGGSWCSTGDEASRFARFMFRRHFYQHCGFRLVRSLPTSDGSKPNPQIRLVQDRVHILGSDGFLENKINLDSDKLQLNYFRTMNKQYYYDSHLHPEILDNELIHEYDANGSEWFQPFMILLKKLLVENKTNLSLATVLGASTGRVAFELTKLFDQVVGVDFCGKFLDVALKLQSEGEVEMNLVTRNNRKMTISLDDGLDTSKIIFKQMTWIPNEIPKSDFIVFSMIDRVSNELSWLKRFREIVKPEGLLVVKSKESKFNAKKLAPFLPNFDLVLETSISKSDNITVWKHNFSLPL